VAAEVGHAKNGKTNVTREKVASCHESVNMEVKLNRVFSLTLDRNEWLLHASSALSRGSPRGTTPLHSTQKTGCCSVVVKRIFAPDENRNPAVKSVMIKFNIVAFGSFRLCGKK